jgi:predicted sulfurtransferase
MTTDHDSVLLDKQNSTVVLFYKYFPPSLFPLLNKYLDFYEKKLAQHQKELCNKLYLKGRILLASEGVNGTLSANSSERVREYISTMENLEIIEAFGIPDDEHLPNSFEAEFLFRGIDWKESSTGRGILEPFPDLKISIVKEIISTGGSVSVQDVVDHGGKHLTPQQFHETLSQGFGSDDVVLIDVRNTFEHDIGHFINPRTEKAALNPQMVTFSHFDATFCAKQADNFKDKKVLMYCTGGIRCEKASVMLKKRGVKDVSQLQGGIHRYLEEFGDRGYFHGRNFVFDQRIAIQPSDCGSEVTQVERKVGKCVECENHYDEISGSRICSVCRDLVLVCEKCQPNLREYHCRRHAAWKNCYFTFLDSFDESELRLQGQLLENLRGMYLPASENKNVRKTLSRQFEKVQDRLRSLEAGVAIANRNAPRRCRTCMDPLTLCDGCCWGFWKTHNAKKGYTKLQLDAIEPLLPVVEGTLVEPGPHWNSLRLGSPRNKDGSIRRGEVREVKSWAAGDNERDCVAVRWDIACYSKQIRKNAKPGQLQIYRWGIVAIDGQRLYDLKAVSV